MFVQLDSPFVDVLVKTEALGADRYELDDDGMRMVGARSGDAIALGDPMSVVIEDVAILRRSVYGRRLGTEPTLERGKGARAAGGRGSSERGASARGSRLQIVETGVLRRQGERAPVRAAAGEPVGALGHRPKGRARSRRLSPRAARRSPR